MTSMLTGLERSHIFPVLYHTNVLQQVQHMHTLQYVAHIQLSHSLQIPWDQKDTPTYNKPNYYYTLAVKNRFLQSAIIIRCHATHFAV